MFGFKVPIILFYVTFKKFTLKLMRVIFASPGVSSVVSSVVRFFPEVKPLKAKKEA